MLDIGEVRSSFPQLKQISPLSSASGQKDVLTASLDDQRVVLKLVKANASHDKRTERELAAMSKVQCSYVPKVIRTGVIELSGGARFFIVEQYIEGETYRDVLIRNPVQSLQSVLALCEAMLSACCDFEAVRIVHRDLKPENLMVDTHGKLWIIDFGIARHLDLLSITPDGGGFGVGTLGYAAPEQFHNIKAEIDARTDLYAAGIIIYEGLTGSHPYMGRIMDHRAILRRMETTDLPRLDIPGDVNGEFARFISALGQRFPSRRPQSAGEAHAWFKQIPLVQGR